MTAATYNGDGQRTTATTSAGTQSFVWDTVDRIPQVIMDSGNAYIYCGGQAPAEQVSLSTGKITYLVTDSLGSVRGTVSTSGTLTGTTSYDAWGNPRTTGGLTATTAFGYADGYTDPTGLIYLLNRYYDPDTGQFISLDPAINQTAQPYSYANGNPVSNTDPTGLYHYWCSASTASTALTRECIYYFTHDDSENIELELRVTSSILDAFDVFGPYVAAAAAVLSVGADFLAGWMENADKGHGVNIKAKQFRIKVFSWYTSWTTWWGWVYTGYN